jgi:glucose/arabinose dehydrogenase
MLQEILANRGSPSCSVAIGSIPENNTFVNQNGAPPKIWSYGYRNALGIVCEPTTK